MVVMTNNAVIGVKFELYARQFLKQQGIQADHNLMYHRGQRRCQVDLESRTGLIFRKHTIYECKYVSPSSSPDFIRYFIQLVEAVLFTGADQGALITNASIHNKAEKEQRYHIVILDRTDIACPSLERRIHAMPLPGDSSFIHRYV
ncbi:TPA: hypothetical protein HA265_05730 [Candidatus Woesearchaeota archaeon]|nr:hypothetical protein [Candidatus Woesearchaeota archaeon]